MGLYVFKRSLDKKKLKNSRRTRKTNGEKHKEQMKEYEKQRERQAWKLKKKTEFC